MRADVGDWIIKGIRGEFYPCKPDIFEQTYEPVPQTLYRSAVDGRIVTEEYAEDNPGTTVREKS